MVAFIHQIGTTDTVLTTAELITEVAIVNGVTFLESDTVKDIVTVNALISEVAVIHHQAIDDVLVVYHPVTVMSVFTLVNE